MRPVTVCVDDRESAGSVTAILHRSPDFQVSARRLPAGDYPVGGRFLFERKTMTDLAIAIIDRRLFAQALRPALSPLRSAVILEGTAAEAASVGRQVAAGLRWSLQEPRHEYLVP